jgi:hypothetical protein
MNIVAGVLLVAIFAATGKASSLCKEQQSSGGTAATQSISKKETTSS